MPFLPPMISSPNVFFADAMLGRLARWLRMLGYDTAYDKAITDQALIERALVEGRFSHATGSSESGGFYVVVTPS